MARLNQFLAGAIVAGMACAFAPMAPAEETGEDLVALNAQAEALDPVDFPYVKAVCTVCHSPAMFLHNHSWEEWQGLFSDMISYGAVGTQEQWDHIGKYFLKAMTFTNVNKALEDELMGVLQVDEPTAIAIMRRQPFRSVADLKAVPGVNAAVVDNLADNSRLEF